MKKRSQHLLHALAAGVLALGLSHASLAATAPAAATEPLALANFVALPKFTRPLLSPDGKTLAVLAPTASGKRNLLLVDLETMKGRAITGQTEFDVLNVYWVGSQRLVYTLGRLDSPSGPESGDGGGLFAIKADGTGYRKLNPTVREMMATGKFQRMGMRGHMPGSENEILVSSDLRSAGVEDIYRINIDTGERKLLTFNQPGRVISWSLDHDGVPRAAMVASDLEALPEERVHRLMVRDTADGEWRTIHTFEHGDKDVWNVLAFAENNKDLIVSARNGKDTAGLHVVDAKTGAITETLAYHPRYDITGGLRFDPVSRKPVGLAFSDDTYQTAYFDASYAGLQKGLEAAFPGKAVALQRSEGKRTLVQIWNDRNFPTYFLYDEERKTLEEALRSRDDMEEHHLVPMRPFLLKTRDGLEIPSYYFLPASYKPGDKLPTVVHVHGGPHVRADVWGPGGFGVREAQILASRGYAVILPNFRITPDLGHKIYDAGFGEVGRKMSEDHEDAAKWGIAQGFVDPARICISGASYGGYATLWAMIKTPEIFKCGVSGLMVSDFELQLTSNRGDTARNKAGVAYWRRLLGQKGSGWERAHEVSPALHAEKLKGPLFIYAGEDDIRTPLEQTRKMVDALKKAGNPPEVVMIKPGEAHGYGKVANNLDLYTQMLEFLDRHIGPKSQSR